MPNLLYNLIMKKFLLILFSLMLFQSVGYCNSQNDEIKIFYAENNIKEAFNLILNIPEDQRTSEQWLLLGNILQDENKSDDAVFMYNKAIICDEKNYKAHYNLGNLYLEQNKPNLAITEFKKVNKYNPDFAYGYYNLGCAYLKINKPKNAKWQFYKAIDLNNQVPDFYYNLAYTFKLLNKEKQANSYLNIYNKLQERK